MSTLLPTAERVVVYRYIYDKLSAVEDAFRRALTLKLENEIYMYTCKFWMIGEPSERSVRSTYRGRARTIATAVGTLGLVERLRSRELWDTSALGVEELDPDGDWVRRKRALEAREAERLAYAAKMKAQAEDAEGLVQCSKCKSKKTTFVEVQTRSADEPMTIFATCKECGHVTKR